MVDLIVGPAVDLLIQKAVDCMNCQYKLRSGVEEKLNKLKEVLNRIKAVAKPADDLDLDEHDNLKKWMQGLKLAAEEAGDVLDEFEYLCLKRLAEGDGADDGARCFPLSFEGLRSSIRQMSISSLYKYATRSICSIYKCAMRFIQSTDPLERLMSIQIKLDKLASDSSQFLPLVADRKDTYKEHHIQDRRKRESISSVVEPEWVERRGVLEEILNKLLEEEPVSDGKSIPVLALVGHGGMGKTTLTQHVFNHTKVKSHFDTRMWAYVSQDFDVPTITRRIMESAAPNVTCSNTESLESLQQKLKEMEDLKYKRFLLVLDDVWYGQNKFWMEEQWNTLCSPLAEVGGKGSKILLTSRTPEVKDLPGPLTTMISLQGLNPEECWSIIQRVALRGHENHDSYQDFVAIGKKIALKVHGSPLAAKAVGGILRNDLNLRRWTNILNMELSKIGEDDVMPVLKLSYRHLPAHLRQCFAYCSLFPKGHHFLVDMLIRMWVALGYIRDPKKGETTEEEIGWSYYCDLLSAGFFTRPQLSGDSMKIAVMHDLMNDLARFVSKNEFLRIENESGIPDTVRHLSISPCTLAELIKKKKKCNLSNLQSLLVIGEIDDFDDNLVKDLFHQLRRVRVLDIRFCRIKQLPDDIGDLVHLRYLDFYMTSTVSLPESLWRLYHLQVLNRNYTRTRHSLEKLNQLVKLRYLGTYEYLELSWIKGLKSLQVVQGNLVVEEGRGGEIGNLKALNELRGQLVLTQLDYLGSGATAKEADLCQKKWLEILALRWRESSACNPDMAAEVLEGLQPPSSLEWLAIHNYPGMAWPNWMAHTSLKKSEILGMKELEEWSGPDGRGGLSCLKGLKITGCPKLRALPTLSLTLNELWIKNVGIYSLPVIYDPNIRNSNNGIISSLSKLSKLDIEDCENLTSLGEGLLQNHERLMDLEEVTIQRCMRLVFLPDRGFREFNSLKRLRIENCPNLTWVAPNQDLDRGLLPPSLEKLSVTHLVDETLSRCLQGLSNLSILEVTSCPCLKSMPSREELVHLTSLQALNIRSCQSLTPSAVLEDLQALPSLKALVIADWPALTPSALEGLQALDSLKQLMIFGCPGLLLETSLTSTADDGERIARGPFPLAIENLGIDNPLLLIKLSVLKSLTSVIDVRITDASQLISFSPELEKWFLQNGTSLRYLSIKKATELQVLPDLPKSLEILRIYDTNQEFQKRYERDIGPDWHKIRHIKRIYITCSN